jgi:hypothetical protein
LWRDVEELATVGGFEPELLAVGFHVDKSRSRGDVEESRRRGGEEVRGETESRSQEPSGGEGRTNGGRTKEQTTDRVIRGLDWAAEVVR